MHYSYASILACLVSSNMIDILFVELALAMSRCWATVVPIGHRY